MFKKIISALGAVFMSAALLTGCGTPPTKNDSKLSIVCTVFPVYDWTRQVVGDSDNIEVRYLLSSGADIHSFQPTADDMIAISDCDMFIYVGGESEEWVDDYLKNARNKDMKTLSLMNRLNQFVVEEEVKEGMAQDDEDDPGYDEHIWLSINQAERCVSEISREVSRLDSQNALKYEENATVYVGELQLLDRSFHMLFDNDPPTLIFGDRFPFRYFVEDYGLDYYAAFKGCSADSDASFETITFLSGKVDEIGADTVFAIENSDCTIADAIITNAKSGSPQIAVLDSIQSVSARQIDEGTTYIGIMRHNYDILKEAFK